MGGAPRLPRPSRRTTQALSTAAVVLVLALVWWLQGSGADDTGSTARDDASASAGPSAGGSATADGRPAAQMPARDEHGLPYVALEELPPEAAETVALVEAGGPFPYPGKDGSTFGNFEGLLPDRPRGYYAEYTVETPGLSHRGARRVVAGDGGELYWTGDHYESFRRIWVHQQEGRR